MKAAFIIGGACLVALVALAALLRTPDIPMAELKQRWATPPSRFIEVGGVQVHIRDEGPRDDPHPIVLIHGTGSSLQTWDGWTAGLKSTRRVIRFDSPGFGLTGPNTQGVYTNQYYIDFVISLLDKLEVRRAVLVGNSAGGRIAWHVAAAHPERVQALILLDAGGYPRSTPLPPSLAMAKSPLGPCLMRFVKRSQVEAGARNAYGNPRRLKPETVDRSLAMMRRPGNRRAIGETLRQAGDGEDAGLVKSIQVPTLILWGSLDTVIPPSDAQRFHKDIAGSQLVMLSGVGHLPQEEVPAESLVAAGSFLAATSRPGAAQAGRE